MSSYIIHVWYNIMFTSVQFKFHIHMFQLFFTGRATKETLYYKCKVFLMIHLSFNYCKLFAYSHFTLFCYCHPWSRTDQTLSLLNPTVTRYVLKKGVWNEKERIIIILLKTKFHSKPHNHKKTHSGSNFESFWNNEWHIL